MRKPIKIEKNDNNSSRYLEWLMVCMCDGRKSNNNYTNFLYEYYVKIYDACHDDNVIAFKCNKKVYEIGQFHKIFTFVVNEYLNDVDCEKNPSKLFIPIYKVHQSQEIKR